MLNLAPIHDHIYALSGFTVPSVLNAVMEVPDDIQRLMQLPAAPPNQVWVMFLTRTLVVANHDEARMIFTMLHEEELNATAPNLSGADRMLRLTQAIHEFDAQLADVDWPTALRAPAMPFVVPVAQVVPVTSLGLCLYRGQPLTDSVTEANSEGQNAE